MPAKPVTRETRSTPFPWNAVMEVVVFSPDLTVHLKTASFQNFDRGMRFASVENFKGDRHVEVRRFGQPVMVLRPGKMMVPH